MCFSLFDLAPSVFSSRFLGLPAGMTAHAPRNIQTVKGLRSNAFNSWSQTTLFESANYIPAQVACWQFPTVLS